VLADPYKGGDPEASWRAGTTLREALEDYVKARKDLRPRSVQKYRLSVTTYLSAWLDRPLREITHEMVEVRHRDITAEIEKRHRAAAKTMAERYSAWAHEAEARGWPEAATRHRAAAAVAEARSLPNGHATANGAMRALSVLWKFTAERVPDLPPNPVARLHRPRQTPQGK
jgi:hypothetical protein